MKKRILITLGFAAAIGIIVGTQTTKPTDGAKVVAIATLMSHPALDAVQEGIVRELRAMGFAEGKTIRYIVRNANGQVQIASAIANDLAAQNPDVIVAITTPMAQAVAKVTRGPIVFAAVTDPVGAGLVQSLNRPGEGITGTSDAWPYEDQLKLIRAISPAAVRLGVLYNPGEAASQYGIRQIRALAPSLGFKLVEGSVSSTGDVYPVAQGIASRVDALYLSSDNTVISGVAAAVRVAIQRKLPLYVGDSGTVEKGGLAAVSVGYAKLGAETGKLVARVLRGERNIPVVVAKGTEVYINKKSAELMGVSVPEAVLRKATKVYGEIGG